MKSRRNAINITLGLPFLRVTPDHGTNNQMIGKNLSNPTSLIEAIYFAKKLPVTLYLQKHKRNR